MTDTSNASPNEEPAKIDTPEIQQPLAAEVLPDEASIILNLPEASVEEVTQASASVEEMPTETVAPPPEEVMPDEDTAKMASFVQETLPVASVQLGEETEPVQFDPYAGAVPASPDMARVQASNPAAFYAQNTYVPQPGQLGMLVTPVPAPAKPRSKALTLVLIIIVALVFFALGGGSVFAYTSMRNQTPSKPSVPSPNSTLKTYCQDVTTGNAQGIYDLLSQQAEVHTSLDDLQQTFRAMTEASSLGFTMVYSGCTFSNLHVSSPLAVATVMLTLSMTVKGQTMSVTQPSLVSLVLENNQWKIDFSSLAQPQPNVTLPTLPSTILTPTAGQ